MLSVVMGRVLLGVRRIRREVSRFWREREILGKFLI